MITGAPIPQNIKSGLERYVNDGIPVGDFLQAVIANDLVHAFARADHNSAAAMHAIAGVVYNDLPSHCWGSRAVYRAFLAYKQGEREGLDLDELQGLADTCSAARHEAEEQRR